MERKIYDLVGIGIGPFNLGLAAICQDTDLDCLFIDQAKSFDWHPGMMIPGTKLQVPFYADLVTLADPCSPYSYLAFLKQKGRLLRFGIHESYFIHRKEYNNYCKWVAGQLPTLQFNCCCENISKTTEGIFSITTSKGIFYSRYVVLGVGTVPNIPECAKGVLSEFCFHSSEYLFHKEAVMSKKSVTIIGSGQSAAEIFYDLLKERERFTKGLFWFTRSARFYPMDYSKFTLEMSSPDYIDYFYHLPEEMKPQVLSGQDELFKGINFRLIDDIYDLLYQQEVEEYSTIVSLSPNCELRAAANIEGKTALLFLHRELQKKFRHESDIVIFATGYRNETPSFLRGISGLAPYKVNKNYSIDPEEHIFVQNAEVHSHGFNSADLSLGPYRNAVILNHILGQEHFSIEHQVTFQQFGRT
jgi:lysine N6-hydroxylase